MIKVLDNFLSLTKVITPLMYYENYPANLLYDRRKMMISNITAM